MITFNLGREISWISDDGPSPTGWEHFIAADGDVWTNRTSFCAVFQKEGSPYFFAAESVSATNFVGPFDSLEAAKTAALMLAR